MGVTGFSRVFLRSYLTPSNNKIIHDNFLYYSWTTKTWFFPRFLPARATGLFNQGKAPIALVYLRPWCELTRYQVIWARICVSQKKNYFKQQTRILINSFLPTRKIFVEAFLSWEFWNLRACPKNIRTHAPNARCIRRAGEKQMKEMRQLEYLDTV